MNFIREVPKSRHVMFFRGCQLVPWVFRVLDQLLKAI